MNESNSRMSNSMYSRSNSMCNKWSSSILRNTIISNISNISIITIGMIVHILSTSIRKSNRVRSSDSSCTISRFTSSEPRARVVIINCIVIGVGTRYIRIDRSSMGNQRVSKNRGMGNNRTSYSMGNWVGNSMDTSKYRSMCNNTSSSMKTVWRVSYSSDTCSKCLGLNGTSVFSLEWFGNRLMGYLTSRTSKYTSMSKS